MKTAAQKYSESNAEAILAYWKSINGNPDETFKPGEQETQVQNVAGIRSIRLTQSTLAGYLEQAFVAGERVELFGEFTCLNFPENRITGNKSPFKREGLHSQEEPMPGRHSPFHGKSVPPLEPSELGVERMTDQLFMHNQA